MLASLLFLSFGAPPSTGEKIAAHAVHQTTWNTVYDPAYVKLAYPNGDLTRTKGVCTDVVIRALRSVGYDLQKLIQQDRKAHPSRYPNIRRADPNIDHRRCPNQIAYFRAHGRSLSLKTDPESLKSWLPGDVVYWKLDNGRDHTGIVTGKLSNGVPWAVHNLGGTRHENVLTSWKIVGHFRFPK